MTNEQRLAVVVERAANQLGGEVGAQLRAMLTPAAAATMVAVLVVWAGSHFFGVGEIADVVLLIVGYVALGGVAWEAGQHLVAFGQQTINAQRDEELSQAADHLAKAIALVGVQTVLALLLKKKPGDTLKTQYTRQSGGRPLPGFRTVFPRPLPRGPGFRYRPTIKFTNRKVVGQGGTRPTGDIVIGRTSYGASAATRSEQLRLTLFHEKVHQVLAPKVYVLRELRIYLQMSAYRRSYILRYVEEAMAETYAQFRVFGLDKEHLLSGVKFPLGSHYKITASALANEARGLLLGPINVGGMVYTVYYGAVAPERNTQ